MTPIPEPLAAQFQEWLNEATRLTNRLVTSSALSASYTGGPLAGKYLCERQAAQAALLDHLAVRPQEQAPGVASHPAEMMDTEVQKSETAHPVVGLPCKDLPPALLRAQRDAFKWGYEYLQSRMESIDRLGWAHDCDSEIASRIERVALMNANQEGGE